ncbi:MAG TPA: VOC family protein [Polyangiaceae bacterium]
MNLYHLHLHVRDLAATSAFYERYFEFQRVFPGAPELFLRSPRGFLLALVERSPDEATIPDWFHLGFQAQSADEARSLFRRMTDDGVSMAVPWTEYPTGTVKFHCVDPDGQRVEVRWDAA